MDDFVETVCIRPKTGRILVFDIDRFHKADVVESGTKTWLGLKHPSSSAPDINKK